jgi:predicted transglutaminase-like cysteine proteinase
LQAYHCPMTKRPETKSTSLICRAALALVAAWVLAGCADTGPRLAKGERGSVMTTAPRLASFSFDGLPLSAATDFAPWAELAAQNEPDQTSLDACIADKNVCATVDLVRFRRMLELAQSLTPREQLGLVHHYFNTVEWTNDTRDTWSTLYHTAFTKTGDCEDIALAKYQTLRRLGWPVDHLRVLIGWDGAEKDWHALLAVRVGTDVLILDSVKGIQSAALFGGVRLVYSISDQGVWDHAPDFVPVGKFAGTRTVPERAARFAATERQNNKGALR